VKNSAIQSKEIERAVDTRGYQDFRGLRFKIINDLPPGQYVELTTYEPTYIDQCTGAIKVTAHAPTIINGCTGEITIDSYAPMLVRGSTRKMQAHLRQNTAIEPGSGEIYIRAAPHLEFVAEFVERFNGWSYNMPVRIKAPKGKIGAILVKGSPGSLYFGYDNQKGLYKLRYTIPGSALRITKALVIGRLPEYETPFG